MKLSNSLDIVFDDTLVEGRGRHFRSRFIEAGIVGYGDSGVLKVTKETIDKFVHTLVGCPVIIRHHPVSDDNVDDLRVGVVSNAWFNPDDGWFWCEGIIWDDEAIAKIGQGWSVSCCYITKGTTGESGEWHNMPYDDELLDGVFEHLAIVPDPRYEEATILLNSKEGKGEMLLKLFNGKKIRNSNEGGEMKKKNEAEIDKNALKNKIMEHVNKAVKGEGEIDGRSEEAWYKEFREMLDKLAYSESEEERSNKKNEKDDDGEEDENKDNACRSNASEDDEEEDRAEDDEEEDEEDKKNAKRKKNSKSDFDAIKRLSNSQGEVAPGYMSEKSRLALGAKMF